MATLDLTLDSFEVPALSEYIPPFGHKKQEGGLSTREVNNNIMMPFLSMRPTIVTENSVTTRIEYDAKLVFHSSLQEAVTLVLNEAAYNGCEILIYNLSAHACTVNKNTWNYTVPAGGYIKLKWNGSAWSKDVSSAVQAAIRDAVADRYSTTETMTNKAWIDGKRIYRKCGVYNNGETIGTGEVLLDSTLTTSYVDTVIATGGSAMGSTMMLNIGGYSGEDYRLCLAITNNGLIKLPCDDTYIKFKWWIEYTKA